MDRHVDCNNVCIVVFIPAYIFLQTPTTSLPSTLLTLYYCLGGKHTGSAILANGFLHIALSCYKPFELQMLKSYNSLDKVPNLPKNEEEFKFIILIKATKFWKISL